MAAVTDRRVHASFANGRVEIVRYDKQGHWYLEMAANYGRPGLPAERVHIGVAEAARRAKDLRDRGGTIFTGVPGGKAFDRLVAR